MNNPITRLVALFFAMVLTVSTLTAANSAWSRYNIEFYGVSGYGEATIASLTGAFSHVVINNGELENGGVAIIHAINKGGEVVKVLEETVEGLAELPTLELVLEGYEPAVPSPDGEGYKALGGLKYDVTYDRSTQELIFMLLPELPAEVGGLWYTLQALVLNVMDDDDESKVVVWGDSGHDWSALPKFVVDENGYYTYTLDVSDLSSNLGLFFNVNVREINGRNLERFIGVVPMSIPNDWGGFDWSDANRFQINLAE